MYGHLGVQINVSTKSQLPAPSMGTFYVVETESSLVAGEWES